MGRSSFGDQYIYGVTDCADSADFSAAGDRIVLVDIALPDWTPAADTVLAGIWNATGNQKSWKLVLKTTGALEFHTSTDGSAANVETSSVTTLSALAANTRQVIQVEHTASSGDVVFKTGATEADLAAYGSTQTGAGATAVFNSTADLEFGTADGSLFEGRLKVAATVEANPIAANVELYESTYSDAQGNIWSGAGHNLYFSRVYPTTAVGLLAPAPAPVQPVSPVPALPEMCIRINALDMTPVTGPTAPDPNA